MANRNNEYRKRRKARDPEYAARERERMNRYKRESYRAAKADPEKAAQMVAYGAEYRRKNAARLKAQKEARLGPERATKEAQKAAAIARGRADAALPGERWLPIEGLPVTGSRTRGGPGPTRAARSSSSAATSVTAT
jgi:hypothetical protein